MAAANPDPDVVSSFEKLKQVLFAHTQERSKNDADIMHLNDSVEQKKFYLRQLSHMGDDLVTYKGVGRAYVRMSTKDIMAKLESAAKAEQDLANRCAQKREVLNDRISKSEKDMRELLEGSPELQNALAINLM